MIAIIIISFLINASQNISKIVNFINSILFFNIFINILIFDIKKKILSNEMIVYKNDIIKKSFINLYRRISYFIN